jgi:Zn-dependent protease
LAAYDLTLQTLLLQAVSLPLIAAVNGLVVSLGARALGDIGPALDGRLTLNPFAHLDILGGLGVIVFGLGWIRPIALTPSALRSKVWGVVAIILAGSAAVAVLALIASLLLPLAALSLPRTGAPLAADFIAKFVRVALGFALVNLIPLPPLAGGYLLDAIWAAGAARLRRHSFLVGLVLLALLATGYPTQMLDASIAPAIGLLMHTGG